LRYGCCKTIVSQWFVIIILNSWGKYQLQEAMRNMQRSRRGHGWQYSSLNLTSAHRMLWVSILRFKKNTSNFVLQGQFAQSRSSGKAPLLYREFVGSNPTRTSWLYLCEEVFPVSSTAYKTNFYSRIHSFIHSYLHNHIFVTSPRYFYCWILSFISLFHLFWRVSSLN